MNFNWIRVLSAWQARFLGRSRRPVRSPQRTHKPWAESLEDRWLPSTWGALTSNTTNDLWGVWAASPTNVYTVGAGGTILHSSDGTSWASDASGTTNLLYGIWGTSATNVYAVGIGGTILHFDGTSWGSQASPTSNDLIAIWGDAASDVYAVGAGGTIVHFDGTSWSTQVSGTANDLEAVWGSSSSDVYAVGVNGVILHSDGSSWSTRATLAASGLNGVWGSSSTNLYTAGIGGVIFQSNDGTTWNSQTSATTNILEGIWGSSAANLYSVGVNGTIVHFNGTSWASQTSGTANELNAVTGSTTTVYAVGLGGTILASTLDSLVFSNQPVSTTAGTIFSTTVTAEGTDGNPDTNYRGTVGFSSSDPNGAVVLPSAYPFVAGDNGVHTFSNGVTLATAGNQTITATDGGNGLTGTSAAVTITPAVAGQLVLTSLTGAVAGTAQSLTVTAKDQYGNVATGYRGTISFSSSDTNGAVVLPAAYPFVAGDNGVHTFSNGVTLVTVGNQTVTATDSSNGLTGLSGVVAITPAIASQLVLTGLSGAVAGTAQSLTVTAKDQYGNVATGYRGTVGFSSSDFNGAVVLPSAYPFVAGDNGVHTFSNGVTLATAGNQTVTATDSGNGITGTSPAVAITPAAASQLVLTGLSGAVAGTAQSLTVTAKDQYGNVATGYRGTVGFSSSDSNGAVVLPSAYPFVAGDNGVHTFSNGVTLATVGNQTVTATDSGNGLTGLSGAVAITPAAASTLVVSGFPTPVVAGQGHNVTVTAKDAYGNVATGYSGIVAITSSDGRAVLPPNATLTNGTGSFSVTLKTAATQSITATDTAHSTITGRQSNITVNPASASQLALTGLSSVTAGTAQTLTVTAKDAFGNVATGYTGTIHFSSSDPQVAGLPAMYHFVIGNAGVHAFANVLLKTAGNRTITATDTLTASITGTSPAVMITPAAAASLSVVGFISPATAGVGQSVTVTAFDQFNNVATGYAGTVALTSSDGKAVLPPNSTLNNGIGTFNVTLKTAATQSITATDTVQSGITGSEVGITITAASAMTLVVSSFPSPTTAGTTQTIVVTAQDAFGNVATGYTGTVHFSSTDHQGQLPQDYTFTSGDAGMKGFTATLKTAGTQSITATDTMSAITGTQSGITITAAAPTAITVGGLTSPATAGVNQNLTVTALDQFGNPAPSYTGTVHFTSTDPRAALPNDYTFASGDNGVHTFSITLKTAGTQAVTATDTVNAGFTASQPGISVSPAAARTLTVAGFAPTTAGVSKHLTVTAFDAFGNVATGYTGTVHFTSSDPQAALPVDYTFAGGDAGVHTFTATLKTAGAQSLTATDTLAGTVTGSQPGIIITPAAARTLSVTGFSGTATAGAGLSVTVTLRDAFGNTAAGYTGTVHFTSTDPQAALPVDYTFVNGDAGVHTFSITFKTAGSQSAAATDTAAATLQAISGAQAVLPAAAAVFHLGAPAGTVVGNFFDLTLTAFDAFGNLATGYRGTVHFGSSDSTALLPADYPFTTADAGSHTFATAAAFRRLGAPTLMASDTASGPSATMAVTSSNPLEEVFAIGTDGQVYGQRFDSAGNPAGGYFLIGPGQVLNLSVGHDAAGRPEVFVLGLDHQIYAHQFDAAGNPAGNYFLVQVGRVQSLAVGRDAVGRPELFVLGLDSQVYAQQFDTAGNPVGSYGLTAVGQVRTLAVGRDAFGQPEAFVIGLDSQVYALKFDTSGNAAGSYFLTQPGRVLSLSVGEDAAFNPEAFVLGLDHQVWGQKFTTSGDSESSYFLTQAGQVTSLSVGQDGTFNPEVFVIGLDHQVYAQQFDGNDNSASGYLLAQAGQVLSLQVGQDAANDPELFVTGLDNQAYGLKLNAAGGPAGGYFLMQPGEIVAFTVAF